MYIHVALVQDAFLRLGAIAVATPLMLGGFAPLAAAHDVVMHATPEDKSVVEEFPHEIVLEFSGIPKPSFNTVAISNSDTKEVLFTGQPDLDKQYVSLKIPEDIDPGPGNYLVGYQITSSDGHATRGGTTFSVGDPNAAASETSDDPAGGATTVATANTESTDNGGIPVWAWGLGAVLVLVIVGGVGFALTRK